MSTDKPVFRDLSEEEVQAMLRAHTYGRLAFAFHDRVDIEPIHYVYESGWLFCRSAPGSKITTLRHHPWVAFEIDDVRGPFEWRSVVVKGAVYFLNGAPGAGSDAYRGGIHEALRRLVPGALTSNDPTPGHTIAFGIHIDSIRGRASS